jgi:hypothetical protein
MVMRFEVQLLPEPGGRWSARLTDGTIFMMATRSPRSEVARALLARGADPRSQMVIRRGAEIIAFDTLGRATGSPVTCTDEGVIEKD